MINLIFKTENVKNENLTKQKNVSIPLFEQPRRLLQKEPNEKEKMHIMLPIQP